MSSEMEGGGGGGGQNDSHLDRCQIGVQYIILDRNSLN